MLGFRTTRVADVIQPDAELRRCERRADAELERTSEDARRRLLHARKAGIDEPAISDPGGDEEPEDDQRDNAGPNQQAPEPATRPGPC